MGQSITLIGAPVGPLRLEEKYMLKEPTALKVYSFDMREDGSATPVKYLPRASKIVFTVFINERQLKGAGLDLDSIDSIQSKKIMVQGELVKLVHLKGGERSGELAVTTRQLRVIPEKVKDKEESANEKTTETT